MEVHTSTMETLISLAKRRGFIFPGSEVYGGLAGTWDYGHLGLALKENIKRSWWLRFVLDREDMFGLDAAILMNAEVWKASGHADGFSDPLISCSACKRRYRADQISTLGADGLQTPSVCPECGGALTEPRQFNMMFETRVGAAEDSASLSYLRPETAQGIFVNFKNVLDAYHPKLPFGIAQTGKAFRNEITPRDFLFRVREFEQMEIEYFVNPTTWVEHFESLRNETRTWVLSLGIPAESVHEIEVPDGERAHYSARTIDFEFEYPFGQKELFGLAYRGDYDLSRHKEKSGTDLSYLDEVRGERFVPHVIEPSFGVDRLVLALLVSAYREDELGGEKRVYLALAPHIAPVKAAVFPLLKNKPALVEKARDLYQTLKKTIPSVTFDDNGNIGKRYRRQDEIGTPWCITVDFDTLEDDTVTLRSRDTGGQERVSITELASRISDSLSS